jgi:hypothetical protein
MQYVVTESNEFGSLIIAPVLGVGTYVCSPFGLSSDFDVIFGIMNTIHVITRIG